VLLLLLLLLFLCLCHAAADEIGVQIEEPFGILPLEDVCVDIQVCSVDIC
jgi:predicted membrane chloride channel (bestrophin family)